MDEKRIAQKVKAFRLNRNMTLDRLAELTDLTKGYLSRIENSAKAPPISTLARIAEALGVDMTVFFSDDSGPAQQTDISIVKRNERITVGRKGAPHGYQYEALAHRMPGKNMEPYVISLSDETFSMEFRHAGEEFIHMLDGQMELFYDGRTHVIEKGDSAYFDAGKVHKGRSVGDRKARFLCVIYSYKRI